ncbi:MAG TPA: hypothetical protein VLQ93_23750, partial [Myxococcaceae bacterium]|nr:hypothetical protein [Myxococcaceae bacterium]
AEALFDHLERTGHTEIEVTEDFDWSIPEKHLYAGASISGSYRCQDQSRKLRSHRHSSSP